jgi:thiol-disulfide isomerase/thioredoxin
MIRPLKQKIIKILSIAGIASFLLSGELFSQSIPKLSFGELEQSLHQRNDTTYVINFWATWCAPCIKELPYFEEVHKSEFNSPVKVILVSLDFPNHFDSKLVPFVNERNLKSTVLYLDDGKAHEWIPKVDKKWSGAIPATLIYKGNKRKFYEGSFKRNELFEAIEIMINAKS